MGEGASFSSLYSEGMLMTGGSGGVWQTLAFSSGEGKTKSCLSYGVVNLRIWRRSHGSASRIMKR